MKVKAIKVFFDNAGLHRKNEVFDTDNFIPELMEKVEVEKTESKKAKKTKEAV